MAFDWKSFKAIFKAKQLAKAFEKKKSGLEKSLGSAKSKSKQVDELDEELFGTK